MIGRLSGRPAGDRRKLRRYLLGPDSPDAQTRLTALPLSLRSVRGSPWRARLSMPAPAPPRAAEAMEATIAQ